MAIGRRFGKWCSVPGCFRRNYGSGFCYHHWVMARAIGSPSLVDPAKLLVLSSKKKKGDKR